MNGCKKLLSVFMSAILVLSVMTPIISVNAEDKLRISVVNLVADGEVSETGYLGEKWIDENGNEVIFESSVTTKKPVANQNISIPSKYASCSGVNGVFAASSLLYFLARSKMPLKPYLKISSQLGVE